MNNNNQSAKSGLMLEKLEGSLLRGQISRRRFTQLAVAAGLLSLFKANAWAEELGAIRSSQETKSINLQKHYDYIVVGAGSAGCALVGRLAADKSKQILLIEAGDWDTAPSILDPRLWFTNLGTEREWGDVAVPFDGVNGRAIPEHTGRVLGGGSSINATIWVRPFKADLDGWAKVSGDDRWNYESSLEVFKRVENWQGQPNGKYRGQNGPVWCQPAHDPLPVAPAMLDACRQMGLPVLDDLNGLREERGQGFALMDHIIRDGRRQNMAKSYLYPVMAQDNVTVLVNTHVNRLIIDGVTVVGVEIEHNGQQRTVAAGVETILSGGGFNTPKLLMLSGIGDEAQLKQHNIETVVHSPEVGKNMQDHLLHGGVLFEPHEAMSHRNSAAEVSGYLKSDPSLELPDISVVQIELPYVSDVVGKEFNPPNSSWAICAGLVTPKSRGEVKLRSSDYSDRPIVEANFLDHPDDVSALVKSVELCREIGASPALKNYVKREVVPGKKLEGKEMVDFVRNGATTYFHVSGTCRMGKDDNAVVDSELRVNGLKKLRIADSSIMPTIVSCPTMAACVLIGERASELLA
uniref:GMC family oxidoreductase n=1 Tax=Marinobacterium profundum TaxID=1714300 RepID=UPI00082F3A57|nr:GMC family oxidoreductase N-terminal domain-containing protein [Marinobacterium profundum]